MTQMVSFNTTLKDQDLKILNITPIMNITQTNTINETVKSD